MTSRRLLVPAAFAAASALTLAGCSTTSSSGADTDTTDDGRIVVVASTNVYGQIVEQIGGEYVDVTSIVASASQDPHSFEPSAQDQLAVSRAELIVENGGGYDSFIDGLIESSGSEAHVITAAEFSHDWPGEGDDHDHGDEDNHAEDEDHDHGDEEHAEDEDHDHAEDEEHAEDEGDDHDHSDHGHIEGFNEHVWYDPHTIEHVAEAIAEELSEIDPDHAETFEAGLDEFVAGIAELEAELETLDAEYGGTEIFVTEPVPLYLTGAAGLVNVAPEAFTEAVEEGNDVPASTMLDASRLLQSGDVKVVIVNAQTGGAETNAVIDEATGLEIPIVEFAETLPEGETYISWMQSNIAALASAL